MDMLTSQARSPRTRPASSPANSMVLTANTRSPPSSWADEVRNIRGQVGHGVDGSRASGGRGMISNWWTETAPCRCTVPEAVGAGVAAPDDHHPLAGGA